jgi:hypothetical protein
MKQMQCSPLDSHWIERERRPAKKVIWRKMEDGMSVWRMQDGPGK